MTASDKRIYKQIELSINSYQAENGNVLIGINNSTVKDVFIRQMTDSYKRVEYIRLIQVRDISEQRTHPNNPLFDPLKAAIWHNKNGNKNEAIWLVFLLTHFGESYSEGWNYTKSVYGKLDDEQYWSWDNIKYSMESFISWLDENNGTIKSSGKFGNHRKFQSLSATKSIGTGATINSFLEFFSDSPKDYIESIQNDIQIDREAFFDYLYKKIRKDIIGFGRLGAFDFLTMIGKMNIYPIEPGHPYLKGATGPLAGAKELYNILDETQLNSFLIDFGKYLNIPFAMQVLEDALCNWQKDIYNYTEYK